jgi:uncharacterized protein
VLTLLLVTELSLDPLRLLAIVLVTAAAGVMNSIAGGGTLLTFPALIGLGVPPIVANATSTVALWPGAVGSMWGYRAQLVGARRWAAWFAAPSLVGGLVGAGLLLATPPERFDQLVPWLVLAATALFIIQGPTARALQARAAAQEARAGKIPTATADPSADAAEIPAATADWSAGAAEIPAATADWSATGGRSATHPETGSAAGGHVEAAAAEADRALTAARPRTPLLFVQLLIGVYGGYFGAGVGILMLAALGFMGLRNIHRMNGLKNWGGLCMNFVAALAFAFSDLVDWSVALAMAVGATTGGYGGSRLAQRVPQTVVRRAIVVIGLGSGIWLLSQGQASVRP